MEKKVLSQSLFAVECLAAEMMIQAMATENPARVVIMWRVK